MAVQYGALVDELGIRGKVKFPPTNHKLQNRSALQQRRGGDVGTGPNSSIKNRTGTGTEQVQEQVQGQVQVQVQVQVGKVI